jgi:alkanesulfonate monooxygenase SsuD/methylene tetrahydromethanopterin reductase-like flavin-dependent oxidoreductase (luciferase family)
VWVAEHHNARENYFTQPMTMCAALSQITDLTVGTGITIGGLWNPSRLAEEAATVDVLSQGNLQVGMGLGYNESEFTGYGIPKGERLPRMKDSIEVCKKGWSGEPFSYDGERFSSEEIHIEPKPPQGTDLPILIGALAEPAIRRAARIADGIIGIPTATYEDLAGMREWLEDEGIDDDFKFHVMKYGFIGDSKEDAWETLEEPYYKLHKQYVEWEYMKEWEGKSPESFRDQVGREQTDEGIDEDLKEQWKSWAIFGDDEDMIQEIEKYEDLMGPNDHFILRLHYPGMDPETSEEAVRRFGEDVIPHFK